MAAEDRKAKLLEVMKELNKNNGAKSVQFGSDVGNREYLTWGVPELDAKLVGIRRGSFQTIYGPKSTGKSTLSYHAIAANQKKGFVCALIDLERNFDRERAIAMGVDVDALVLVIEVETAEQAMNIVKKLTQEKVVDLIFIDSVQGMSPEGEQYTSKGVEKDMADNTMGLLPRKLSEFFRRTSGSVYRSKAGVVLIGQTRKNLGSFIVVDTLSGGNALLSWSSAIIAMVVGQKEDAPAEKFKEESVDPDGKTHKITKTRYIGSNIRFKIEKTKITGSMPEKSEFALPLWYDTGYIAPKPTNEVVEKVKEIKEAIVEAVDKTIEKIDEIAKESLEEDKEESDGTGRVEYTPAVIKAEGMQKKRGRKPKAK